MARKYFEQAADALVRAYAQVDRPAPGFFELLADKGYLRVDSRETLAEKAIRGLFGGLASGVETVTQAVERLDQPEFGFFDLLSAKGYLPQNGVAGVVPAFVANDNRAPDSGGDRRAA